MVVVGRALHGQQCRPATLVEQREEDGAEAADQLCAEGQPDDVITYNDAVAVGLLDVLAPRLVVRGTTAAK